MSTLFVICNGAKSAYDVSASLNSTYGGSHDIIKSVRELKTDKFGNTYTIVEIYRNGTFRESRMDRLISQLEDPRNRGEKHVYQVRPNYIEWTIKLHIRDSPSSAPTTAPTAPKFR